MQWMTGLLTFVVVCCHVAGIVAAMHAVIHTRTPQGAFAWALGLMLLPYATLVPYLYLGRNRFIGYRQHRLHRLRQTRSGRESERERQGERDASKTALPCDRYLAISSLLGRRFHDGQRLRLLIDGETTFAAIFEAIAQAKECVLMQFFIFHDDALGRRMQKALLDRAAAGVKVYVLYDGIGSHDLPKHYVETLRAGGVAIHPFATQRHHNRFQLNFRNHRKIVVVDGWRGFVGGLNVGDEYMGLKPPLAPWRDTHMEVQGSAVTDLQASFSQDWQWVTGELPLSLPARACLGSASTLIANTGPADAQESCSLYFVNVINAARRRLWLTTPYYVPDNAVMSALRLAVFRGVDVRILIPSRPDHKTVFLSSTLHANEAVHAGIRVFRYQPGFVHQKVMLIDDDTVSLGSMNLDNRSFRLNFEVGALNIDTAFASEVEAMLRNDFERSVEVGDDEYRQAPYLKRLSMHVARLFDPVL